MNWSGAKLLPESRENTKQSCEFHHLKLAFMFWKWWLESRGKAKPPMSPICFWLPRNRQNKFLVFAANAETGEPVSGCSVKLIDENNKLVSQGRTNEKGLLLTNLSLEHIRVIAFAPDGSVAETQIESEPYERYTVYIYTDRPIYRPNQRFTLRALPASLKKANTSQWLTNKFKSSFAIPKIRKLLS